MFVEEDFNRFRNILNTVGDKYFVVIRHTDEHDDASPLRLKFPSNITWEEITSGNYISSVFLFTSRFKYYIISESGNWGKVTDNDFHYPVDIWCFKPNIAEFFRSEFLENMLSEKEDISATTPEQYLKRINW